MTKLIIFLLFFYHGNNIMEEKCMRCGHDLIIGGNIMLSDIGVADNDEDDAMVTNMTCPYCGAYYEVTDTPESEKCHYPYWLDDENK